MTKKIAVLVSGGGTNLQALIDAKAAGQIAGGEFELVVASKPGVYALERAAKAGIKAVVLERKAYPDVHAYSTAMRDTLLEAGIDIVVYAGFLTILDESVCDAFPGRMINVHPALIPSFSGKGFYGLKVHEAALSRGVKVTGATVHIVTSECDGGPILLQKAVEVKDTDTPETLQKRVMEEAEWVILPKALEILCKQEEE
jgi:phosphoribosylglycinamide formyltransferase-1